MLRFRWNLDKYRRNLFDTSKWYSSIPSSLPLRVLFFGADNFSLPSLQMLHQETKSVSELAVVTSIKNPANSVRKYAENHYLPIIPWPTIPESCSAFDLGVAVSFGYLIPERIIEAFPLGIINVHASLLPRWRGAAPIIYAIMHNDATTGVSVMQIAPKSFDIGNVLAQKSIPISAGIFMPDLHHQLAHLGAILLCEVINGYPSSFQNAKEQDNNLATYAPKVTNALTEIDWSSLTAEQIYNRYRALYGYKNLTAKFENKSLHLLDVRLPSGTQDKTTLMTTGQLWFQRSSNSLLVVCAENTILEIHKLRLEGRKAMTALEFNNGFLCKRKEKLKSKSHVFERK